MDVWCLARRSKKHLNCSAKNSETIAHLNESDREPHCSAEERYDVTNDNMEIETKRKNWESMRNLVSRSRIEKEEEEKWAWVIQTGDLVLNVNAEIFTILMWIMWIIWIMWVMGIARRPKILMC